jgi:hypothetical protein
MYGQTYKNEAPARLQGILPSPYGMSYIGRFDVYFPLGYFDNLFIKNSRVLNNLKLSYGFYSDINLQLDRNQAFYDTALSLNKHYANGLPIVPDTQSFVPRTGSAYGLSRYVGNYGYNKKGGYIIRLDHYSSYWNIKKVIALLEKYGYVCTIDISIAKAGANDSVQTQRNYELQSLIMRGFEVASHTIIQTQAGNLYVEPLTGDTTYWGNTEASADSIFNREKWLYNYYGLPSPASTSFDYGGDTFYNQIPNRSRAAFYNQYRYLQIGDTLSNSSLAGLAYNQPFELGYNNRYWHQNLLDSNSASRKYAVVIDSMIAEAVAKHYWIGNYGHASAFNDASFATLDSVLTHI